MRCEGENIGSSAIGILIVAPSSGSMNHDLVPTFFSASPWSRPPRRHRYAIGASHVIFGPYARRKGEIGVPTRPRRVVVDRPAAITMTSTSWLSSVGVGTGSTCIAVSGSP